VKEETCSWFEPLSRGLRPNLQASQTRRMLPEIKHDTPTAECACERGGIKVSRTSPTMRSAFSATTTASITTHNSTVRNCPKRKKPARNKASHTWLHSIRIPLHGTSTQTNCPAVSSITPSLTTSNCMIRKRPLARTVPSQRMG